MPSSGARSPIASNRDVPCSSMNRRTAEMPSLRPAGSEPHGARDPMVRMDKQGRPGLPGPPHARGRAGLVGNHRHPTEGLQLPALYARRDRIASRTAHNQHMVKPSALISFPVSSPPAEAHNLKVTDSNPIPATRSSHLHRNRKTAVNRYGRLSQRWRRRTLGCPDLWPITTNGFPVCPPIRGMCIARLGRMTTWTRPWSAARGGQSRAALGCPGKGPCCCWNRHRSRVAWRGRRLRSWNIPTVV